MAVVKKVCAVLSIAGCAQRFCQRKMFSCLFLCISTIPAQKLFTIRCGPRKPGSNSILAHFQRSLAGKELFTQNSCPCSCSSTVYSSISSSVAGSRGTNVSETTPEGAQVPGTFIFNFVNLLSIILSLSV